MTQGDTVIKAINNLGGIATLKQIYEEVKNLLDFDWETKTPEASIRRLVRHTAGVYVVRTGVYSTNPQNANASYLYRKMVDKSLLTEGFSIPKKEQPLFHALTGGAIHVGEERPVKFIIDGQEYECSFKNQIYDRQVYANHSDVVQFRYSPNSPLAKKFRQLFPVVDAYVKTEMKRKVAENDRRNIRYPEELQEYIILNATPLPDVFVVDIETRSMKEEAKSEITSMNELDFETSFVPRMDEEATLVEKTKTIKVRQLDRSIGDGLKKLYNYHCQMTGELVGEPYGVHCVEAHHLIPFTKSMNNNPDNIIIISPSYHRIIHQAKPEWIPEEKAFHFPNGLVEKVKINKHL